MDENNCDEDDEDDNNLLGMQCKDAFCYAMQECILLCNARMHFDVQYNNTLLYSLMPRDPMRCDAMYGSM